MGKKQPAQAALFPVLSKAEERYLTGPVIAYPGGWGEEFSWLKEAIRPARILWVTQTDQAEYCTEEEALFYLSTASLCLPLDHDWAEIMFWLCQRVLVKYQKLPEGSLAETLGCAIPTELSSYHTTMLNHLRADIRRDVIKNRK